MADLKLFQIIKLSSRRLNIKKFKVNYIEYVKGWDIRRTGTCEAEDEKDAQAVFESWSRKNPKYRRKFISAEEVSKSSKIQKEE